MRTVVQKEGCGIGADEQDGTVKSGPEAHIDAEVVNRGIPLLLQAGIETIAAALFSERTRFCSPGRSGPLLRGGPLVRSFCAHLLLDQSLEPLAAAKKPTNKATATG